MAKTYIQPKHTTGTATLTVAGWDASLKQQAVSVTGVTTSNTVFVSPSGSSYLDYANAQIRCVGQATGILLFQCENVPTSDITVNVVII